jgi:hypothetical protein
MLSVHSPKKKWNSPDPLAGHRGSQKRNRSCDPSIDRNLCIDQEKIYFWGSKRPKTEFGAQNQYVRVIHGSEILHGER